MIDLQSSATVQSPSHRSCHSPSPGGDLSHLGSGEKNMAKPKVAWRPSEQARASQRRDEGELRIRGRQSPLIYALDLAPSIQPPLSLSKAFEGSRDILPGLSKTDAKAFQTYPRYSKPFQAIFRIKKIVYFL